MGTVMEKLEHIEEFIKTHDQKDIAEKKKTDVRLTCVEKRQDKFAWYTGVAVGIGAVIMFFVDRIYDFIQRIK